MGVKLGQTLNNMKYTRPEYMLLYICLLVSCVQWKCIYIALYIISETVAARDYNIVLRSVSTN